MTDYTVSSGAISSGLTLNSGDELYVRHGGQAVGTLVNAGAIENISGSSLRDIVSGGEYVWSGGVTTSATIQVGGYLVVYANAAASACIVDSGGAADIYGIANGSVISSGGVQDIFSGGKASGASVLAGGDQVVFSGGTAFATVIGFSAANYVSFGGTASGSIIGQGGYEAVSAGARAVSAAVEAGAIEYVFAGGIASAAEIGSGGAEAVYQAGSASGTLISSGGDAFVYGGATLSAARVLSGGALILLPGAIDSGSVLSAGSLVISSGVVEVTQTYALVSHGGGLVTGANLHDGGQQYVLPHGDAGQSVLSAGGVQKIYSGGIASGTFLASGGVQLVSSGAVASAGLASGGGIYVYSGGVTTGSELTAGGSEQVSFKGDALGTVVSGGGAQYVFSGGVAFGTRIDSGGTGFVYSGGLDSAAVISSGGVERVSSGGSVASASLQTGGAIDLIYLPEVAGGTAALNPASDVLTVTEAGSSVHLQLAGSYAGELFQTSEDPSGGTLITAAKLPCYCRGTQILTDRGEIPIETLAVGDLVINRYGELKPIRWIGRRAYSGRFAARNPGVLPILIEQDAIEDGVPVRDLMVSPLHALLLDEILVPARSLVNGGSIRQLREVTEVEYFHLELDAHDVIIADGAEAESFADDANRGMFQNSVEWGRLHPHAMPTPAVYCALRLDAGPVVSALRRRLGERGASRGVVPPDAMTIPLAMGATYVVIPPGAGALRLVSARGKVGADVRTLGALISSISIGTERLGLTDSRLASGFNQVERHSGREVRWTDGDAVVVLDPLGPSGLRCEIIVTAVVAPDPAPVRLMSAPLRASGMTRVKLPAGVSQLQLLSSFGRARDDGRQLGALISGFWIDGEAIELGDERFADGFHPAETHGERWVRWTDGDGTVALTASDLERWCEIEVWAVMDGAERRRAG